MRIIEHCRGLLRRVCGTGRYSLLAVLAGLLLAGCAHTPDRGAHRDDVSQCSVADSPECAAARQRFQVVRYPTFSADQLVAAASRALGDLDFETSRDDRQMRVAGDYIASAPVHHGQLDELFRKSLKHYGQASLTAQAEILPLPQQDIGVEVRLRLYTAPEGTAPQPVDSVAPYQIFFSQLGVELGAPAAPLPQEERPQDRRRQVLPSISGV